MYKAVLFHYDHIEHTAPTAKEIQDYFKKSTRLLYSNNKRKSKSTPIPDKIDLVVPSFNAFKMALIEDDYIEPMLYVFDDKANSSMLALKYANQVICHFKLDEKIADEMSNINSSYGHLTRYKYRLQGDIDYIDVFAKQSVGSKAFHKKFAPPFLKSAQVFISKVEQEMKALELEAKRLFYSGWD